MDKIAIKVGKRIIFLSAISDIRYSDSLKKYALDLKRGVEIYIEPEEYDNLISQLNNLKLLLNL